MRFGRNRTLSTRSEALICAVGLSFVLIQGAAYLIAAQSLPDDWLVLTKGERGAIDRHTTRADLVKRFGAKNVVDEDVSIGEGDTEPGTVIFPDDPERRLEILWKSREGKNVPKSAIIAGKRSRWHATNGISLGTPLSELERINGRPFSISFGTDEPGTVLSWHSGRLEAEFGQGQVFVVLGPASPGTRPKRGGSSDLPGIRKLDLRISGVTWEFLDAAE